MLYLGQFVYTLTVEVMGFGVFVKRL